MRGLLRSRLESGSSGDRRSARDLRGDGDPGNGEPCGEEARRRLAQKLVELAPGGLMLGRAQMLERVDIRRGRELLDLIKESTAAIGDARIANRECRKQLARGRAEADQIDAAIARRRNHAASGLERAKRG